MSVPEPVVNVVESIPSRLSHAIGATSGITGLALAAEQAKHLTTIGGLVVLIISGFGACFYGLYWAVKAFREIKSNNNQK